MKLLKLKIENYKLKGQLFIKFMGMDEYETKAVEILVDKVNQMRKKEAPDE